MSNFETDLEKSGQCEKDICGSIKFIIHGKKTDLGGFTVSRLLPHPEQKMVGPWIFFDHMGPANFKPGTGVDVRPHPHLNLATVTYLFEGEILHRDSLGSLQTITPGDINLMFAGKGIVHSERERPEIRNSNHKLDGLQLWLALPEEMEELDPAFYHYEANSIPTTEIDGVKIRIMMGEAFNKKSKVKTFAKTLYCEAFLKKGQTLEIPSQEERAIYIANGEIEIEENKITATNMAVLNNKENIKIKATQDSRIAIIGGEKMPKRHIYWNFVSSSIDRIKKGEQDWLNGKFPTIPDDNNEFIPLP